MALPLVESSYQMTTPVTATAATRTTARKTAVAGDSGNDKKKKNVPPGLDGHKGTIQAIAIRAADDSVVVCVALQNK